MSRGEEEGNYRLLNMIWRRQWSVWGPSLPSQQLLSFILILRFQQRHLYFTVIAMLDIRNIYVTLWISFICTTGRCAVLAVCPPCWQFGPVLTTEELQSGPALFLRSPAPPPSHPATDKYKYLTFRAQPRTRAGNGPSRSFKFHNHLT